MEYIYETIEHNRYIPVKIFTQTIDRFPYHWHEDTELLFVLSGELEITVENATTTLREGNVFLVNSNVLHYIDSVSDGVYAKLLVLQFDINHFAQYDMDASEVSFDLSYKKKGSEKRQAYNQVRGILASMMKVVINEEEPVQLLVERHLMDLMIVLMGNFRTEADIHTDLESSEKRVMEILKYISLNCKDQRLSLDRIADSFHLSPQYLSRYFKSQVGVSLKKFIDNMRMNKSLQALKVTDDRIIDIALRYGFADAKAYYRVFKETMGMTPADYREQNRVAQKPKAMADYFSINSRDSLAKLFEYIGQYQYQLVETTKETINYEVDMSADIALMPKSATEILTFGYAAHGLMSSLDEQLAVIQKDIGFRYARFHGIFCDDMMVYRVTPEGDVYYNFSYTDSLIDKLLAYGLRPFLELGFMPKNLASGNQTIFQYEANITPPKDMAQWQDMIASFLRHCLNRYGVIEVLQWRFEFWNEPEMSAFFQGSITEFVEFYEATREAVKGVHPELIIGGFGTVFHYGEESWLERYVALASEKDLAMDFFSFHMYQVKSYTPLNNSMMDELLLMNEDKSNNNFDKRALFQQIDGVSRGGEMYMAEQVDLFLQMVGDLKLTNGPVYITEWNSSPDASELIHDTCYMAAYIVKTVLESVHKVAGLGFWTFSDIFEEVSMPQPMFHGGFGLMTTDGTKKAAYYGYAFLGGLGDEIVWQGEDGIITRKGEDYQILLFNYCHYNDLYNNFDFSQISPTNRYDVFKNQSNQSIALKLDGLNGNYCIERMWVNRNQGSSYDAWVRMGAPEEPSTHAIQAIRAAAEPGYSYERKQVNGVLAMTVHMEPHEIQMVILKKEY